MQLKFAFMHNFAAFNSQKHVMEILDENDISRRLLSRRAKGKKKERVGGSEWLRSQASCIYALTRWKGVF